MAKKAEPTVKEVAPKDIPVKTYMCLTTCFFRGKLYKPERRGGPMIQFPGDAVMPIDKHTGKPCFVEIHLGAPPQSTVPKVPAGAYIRPREAMPVFIKEGKRGKIGYGIPLKPQPMTLR